MHKVISASVILLALVLLNGSLEYASAHPPVVAAVEFGHPHTGTGIRGHDASGHATDSLNPRTTIVPAGATVFFGITSPVHAVAIYDDGTEPGDINVTINKGFGGCPGGPTGDRFIDDATDRLVLFNPPCSGGADTVQFTFNTPGRFLVICAFDSHFNNADMFGWVVVK